MRLFTCKKYDFLIKKNLPSLPASHSISRSVESEIEFIFPSTQNQGGAESVSQRICRISDRFIFGSKYLWGWLWVSTDNNTFQIFF